MNYSIGVVRGDGGVPQGAAGLGDVGRGRVQDQLPLQTSRATGAIPKNRRWLEPPPASQRPTTVQHQTSQITPTAESSTQRRTQYVQPPNLIRVGSMVAELGEPYQSWWNPREFGRNAEVYSKPRSALPPDKSHPRSLSVLTPTKTGQGYWTPEDSVYDRQATCTPSLQVMRRKAEDEKRAVKMRSTEAEIEKYTNSVLLFFEQQRLQQCRERLRQNIETMERLERLADAEVEEYNLDLSGMRQDLERQKQKQNRLERRYHGETVSSSSTGEELGRTFKHLSQVAGKLNDPRTRDNPEVLASNIQQLGQVTQDSIARGLEKSLDPYESRMENRVAETLARELVKLKEEIKAELAQKVSPRVKWLEDVQKLRTRINTEKQDSIRPLLYYPLGRASEENYRRALVRMTSEVKIIERSCKFAEEPFNFLLNLASESNKIAMDFGLDEEQQRATILRNIPSFSPVYRVMVMATSLKDMMSLISTLATQVSTKRTLENKLNEWRLDTGDENQLYMSIVTLIDLVHRNQESYGTIDPHPPTLFREAVKIILRQKGLPDTVRENISMARMKIYDGDSMTEIAQTLLSACHELLYVKMPRHAKVKAVAVPENEYQEDDDHDYEENTFQDDEEEDDEDKENGEDQNDEDYQDDGNDGDDQDDEDQGGDDQDDEEQGGDDQDDEDQEENDQGQDDGDDQDDEDQDENDQGQDDGDEDQEDDQSQGDDDDQGDEDQEEDDQDQDEGDDDDDKDDEEDDCSGDGDSDSSGNTQRMFVKPWPLNKKYLAKHGGFRSDFETHFQNFCHRCGHSSHYAARCRLYTDFCTELCSVCRQGCHVLCLSRRRDLQPLTQANQLTHAVMEYLKKHGPPFTIKPPTDNRDKAESKTKKSK
jgi:hypothetical protein